MTGSNSGGAALQNGNNKENKASETRPDEASNYQDVAGGPTNIKIKVSFGSNQHPLFVQSDCTFGDLKEIVAREIGLEPKVQKLFFRGIEKEDHDYLHMAGVKQNSKILIMEKRTTEIEKTEEVKTSTEISIGGAAVAEVRAEVDKLSEQVSALEAVLNTGTKVDEKDILYLTEMLMRQLLKLDGIEAQGDGKVQRKMEVRRVQSFVETVDNLKAKNSNPSGNTNSAIPVTTQWETFESGVESLSPPSPEPEPASSSKVTQDWERFD